MNHFHTLFLGHRTLKQATCNYIMLLNNDAVAQKDMLALLRDALQAAGEEAGVAALSVNSPDSGAAEEELAVAYGDERLEIGFNAKYLLEIASQVDRENAVFLFNSSGDPTLMREGNDMSAVYVVMPMRV